MQHFSLCRINAGNLNGPCPLREPIKTHDLLSLAHGHYQPYCTTVSLRLTTALLSRCWVPETSRSFPYWQPVPRLMETAPIAGNPVRSPPGGKGNYLDSEVPLQTTPQVHAQSTQKIALNEEHMEFRRM